MPLRPFICILAILLEGLLRTVVAPAEASLVLGSKYVQIVYLSDKPKERTTLGDIGSLPRIEGAPHGSTVGEIANCVISLFRSRHCNNGRSIGCWGGGYTSPSLNTISL
jgi:hypothetical protein